MPVTPFSPYSYDTAGAGVHRNHPYAITGIYLHLVDASLPIGTQNLAGYPSPGASYGGTGADPAA
jgi:hypothetical protein